MGNARSFWQLEQDKMAVIFALSQREECRFGFGFGVGIVHDRIASPCLCLTPFIKSDPSNIVTRQVLFSPFYRTADKETETRRATGTCPKSELRVGRPGFMPSTQPPKLHHSPSSSASPHPRSLPRPLPSCLFLHSQLCAMSICLQISLPYQRVVGSRAGSIYGSPLA